MSGGHQTTENLPGAQRAAGEQQEQGDISPEATARRMGWHPKEQFRGNPEDWVDAEEFVRRGEAHLPILRENLRKSDARAARLEAQVARTAAEQAQMATQLGEARQAVVDIREMLTTSQERAYQRAIKDIEARMDAAIDEGDAAGAKKARADLTAVTEEMTKRAEKKATTEEKKTSPAPPQVTPNAEAVAWVNSPEQSWYRGNIDAKAWADARYDTMNADPKTKNLTFQEKVDKIRESALKKFPEYFDASEREAEPPAEHDAEPNDEVAPRKQAKVSTPRSPSQQRGNGRSFNDLPQDAKLQFERVKAQIDASIKANGRGRPVTKEQWASDYFGPEEKE